MLFVVVLEDVVSWVRFLFVFGFFVVDDVIFGEVFVVVVEEDVVYVEF